MAGRYLNNRGYLPSYLPAYLPSVSRHFAVAWQSCCCSVAIFRGCSGPRCTNITILPRIARMPTDVGGYGIPAIPMLPSEFLPQNPLQVCLRKSSHGIHGIHRSLWWRRASHRFHRFLQMKEGMASLPYPRRPPNSSHRTHSKFACASPPTDCTEFTESSGGEEFPTDAHRWFSCVEFSHGIHGIHRSFWRRRASHRCAQMHTDI